MLRWEMPKAGGVGDGRFISYEGLGPVLLLATLAPSTRLPLTLVHFPHTYLGWLCIPLGVAIYLTMHGNRSKSPENDATADPVSMPRAIPGYEESVLMLEGAR